GRLAIERGPGGETSFVNRWYTVRNGTVSRKHIFAGDQRIATKRVMPDGVFEQMQYFMHQNLQGSTNLVTDDAGELFQRIDYFPSGEIWIHEHGTVFRTPYLFADSYFDEFRELVSLGERWYDPREAFLYSPDPVLSDDPDDVIADPAMLPAYTYAQSNPFSLIDPTGRDGELARARLTGNLRSLDANSGPSATAASDPTDPSAKSSRLSERIAEAPRDSTRGKVQAFADALDAQPLLKFSFKKEAGSDDGWGLKGVQVSPTFTKLGQRARAFPSDDDDPDASMSGPSADTGKPAPGSAGATAAAGGMDDLSQPNRPDSDADAGDASSLPKPESDAN
ncbi:MAG: RHS repeat-associated core domain-containing protein, partial [Acidimicrobiia bacterium]